MSPAVTKISKYKQKTSHIVKSLQTCKTIPLLNIEPN